MQPAIAPEALDWLIGDCGGEAAVLCARFISAKHCLELQMLKAAILQDTGFSIAGQFHACGVPGQFVDEYALKEGGRLEFLPEFRREFCDPQAK
jgi:hypothetical protein